MAACQPTAATTDEPEVEETDAPEVVETDEPEVEETDAPEATEATDEATEAPVAEGDIDCMGAAEGDEVSVLYQWSGQEEE
jgi:hypothetical protein